VSGRAGPPGGLDGDEPVFAEPWQAQAFALAVVLSERGAFDWPQWSAALAAEIRHAAERGDADAGAGYYGHWLKALEKVVVERGFVDEATLAERREAWRRAYLNTPHGLPVELAAAEREE
jgi:nitrile hydratase accessory protein